ncbi:Crp/Fnr family transcriptional regulator [Tenacibaculum sp. 190524A05c]|uniref:Transcriptional regulator, Crp family protein n=1 Tax=Tenacibaculum platacis TaxID=3137852 RepID=A0ABM9P0W5_9FLAO
MKSDFLIECYPEFEKELIFNIETYGILKDFSCGEFIVTQGNYVKYLPIIQEGCVKVFSQEDSKDFLLYFIESGESCIYSFAHLNNNTAAKFSAIAEIDSLILLLPIERVKLWIKKYNSLNQIIINNYQKHYDNLLNTTKQIICYNLEDRLFDYLRKKSELSRTSLLNISHKEIALDLGTSREVISRLLKSNKFHGKIKQEGRRIKIL